MAKSASIPSEEEVEEYKKLNSELFLEALKNVKEVLDELHSSTIGRKAIHRIETRGDNQLGEEFKTTFSIRNKLLGNRAKLKGTHHWIELIEDMIAIRIICIFPSDKIIIGKYLREKHDKEIVVVKDPEKDKKKKRESKLKRGFRAHNFVVKPSSPQLRDFKCEIQICTLLELAWDRKTHDPIYKGRNIKTEHAIQSKLLSDALSTMDEMTELLNQEIKKENAEEKHAACKIELIKALELKDPIKPERKEIIKHIKKLFEEREKALTTADKTTIKEILEQIANYKKVSEVNSDMNSSRLYTLLALTIGTTRFEKIAIKEIDDYISTTTRNFDKARAQILKSLMLFCFNELDQAIKLLKETLKIANRAGKEKEKVINVTKANLAYFIADLGDATQKELAIEYVKEIRKSEPENGDFLDIEGYILITFGKSFNEIYKGLSLCRKYYEQNKKNKVAEAFYKLHHHRAIRQLGGLH